jgi:hypothetical protein
VAGVLRPARLLHFELQLFWLTVRLVAGFFRMYVAMYRALRGNNRLPIFRLVLCVAIVIF